MAPWVTLVAGIAGGVVGVGGTCLGAWLTGRTQTSNLRLRITAENEQARHADKRQVYARFVASLNEIFLATSDFSAALGTTGLRGNPADAQPDALRAVTDAIRGMWRCEAELQLIAPADLGHLARETTLQFSGLAVDTLEAAGKQTGPPDTSPSDREVLRALRADLGEPDEPSGSQSSGRS